MPTGPQIPEDELLLLVRRRIDEGRVPVAIPASITAGYGSAEEICRICDVHIMQHQVMYEIKDLRGSDELTFHLTCYMTWQRECAQRLATTRTPVDDGS